MKLEMSAENMSSRKVTDRLPVKLQLKLECITILSVPSEVSNYKKLKDSLEQCFSTGPGINYTGPREVLLEFVILVF